jgi:MFS family permease
VQLLRRLEIVVLVLSTTVLVLSTTIVLPTLLLYALDFATGTLGPGSGWAAALTLGSVGLWAAVLSGSHASRSSPRTWLMIAALVLAAGAFLYLFWGSARAGGLTLASGTAELAASAVAIRTRARRQAHSSE